MNTISNFLLVCLCILISGTAICETHYPSYEKGDTIWELLGTYIFDVISKPNSIEYFEVIPTLPGPNQQTYEPSSKVVTLFRNDVRKLQKFLLSDSSYHFGVLKKCVFIPDTAFSFKSDMGTVLAIFSSNCKQIKFVSEEQTIRIDIDPAYNTIVDLIEQIQTLYY